MWDRNSRSEKEPENLYGVNIMFFKKKKHSVDEFKHSWSKNYYT